MGLLSTDVQCISGIFKLRYRQKFFGRTHIYYNIMNRKEP